MKTRFVIFASCRLRDETVVLSGEFTGPPLLTGQRGRGIADSGQVEIEVIDPGRMEHLADGSIGQSVVARIISGDPQLLKGMTINFD